MVVLSVSELTIARGEFVLCEKLGFELHSGDICHLVGENGLGKTTLLMQLMGLLPTLIGKIDYLGQPSAQGAVYVGHQSGMHERLSVAQNLRFLLSLYQVTPSDDELEMALAEVGLSGYQHIKSSELSAGQIRRVGLAKLWLLDAAIAPLWVLDEPLTALDTNMVANLSARIAAFAQLGGAVLLTSHQPVAIATKTINLADYHLVDYRQEVQDE